MINDNYINYECIFVAFSIGFTWTFYFYDRSFVFMSGQLWSLDQWTNYGNTAI